MIRYGAKACTLLIQVYRYLAEFDFRYNSRANLDVTATERATKMLKSISGKRLTYRSINDRPTGDHHRGRFSVPGSLFVSC
jgi:hypothetical protein